ncbi:MAG: protein kinase [Bacteroidales bacterium]|nr:protein kinase [Bacteroidales bacterium]
MNKLDELKKLIDQYVRSGMNEGKREDLRKHAADMGINMGELLVLIKSAEIEIAHVTGKQNTDYPDTNDELPQGSGFVSDNQGSGFVSDNQGSGFVDDDNSNSGSGFIDESSQSGMTSMQNLSAQGGDVFSEVKLVDSSGAMSDIYSAVHLGRRKVIIKRIKQQYRTNQQYIDLFYKEFDNAFALEHNNIVHVYGKGEDADGPYYYMEYIDGRTLAYVINVEHRQDINFVRRVVVEILDALSYVHKKQIFHRDLKPENIMLTYKGDNVKIIDFGLAAADDLPDNLRRAGTPKYAAPELNNKAYSADQRADIYSLGMIILEWLAGAPDRRKLAGISNQIFREIADKSTMQYPESRYTSCDEILSLLRTNDAAQPKASVPDWLAAKIREYAADGVITRKERKDIDFETSKNAIDPKAVELLMDVELEKARERMIAAEKSNRDKINRGIGYTDKNSQPQKSKLKPFQTFLFLVIIAVILVVLAMELKEESELTSKPKTPPDTETPVAINDDSKFAKGEIVYTKANLKLRELASKSSKVLQEYPKGTPVEVIEDGYYWVEVRVNLKRGYMAKEFLTHKKK